MRAKHLCHWLLVCLAIALAAPQADARPRLLHQVLVRLNLGNIPSSADEVVNQMLGDPRTALNDLLTTPQPTQGAPAAWWNFFGLNTLFAGNTWHFVGIPGKNPLLSYT